jgi:Domain of unknown function (DUF5069)
MVPLDLTVHPPRSPYQKLEGLFMMPRTIDKLRAQLPGGKIGAYTVRGSSPLLPGLSLVLLDGIGVTEDRLLRIVEQATTEDEIADWLRKNADLSNIESVNENFSGGGSKMCKLLFRRPFSQRFIPSWRRCRKQRRFSMSFWRMIVSCSPIIPGLAPEGNSIPPFPANAISKVAFAKWRQRFRSIRGWP